MLNITVKTNNGEITRQIDGSKVLLSEILNTSGLTQNRPCGGRGVCGKCKISASGELSPISENEKKLLTNAEITSGIRLSCEAYALGGVYIDYNIEENDIQGILTGIKPDFSIEPVTGKKVCYGAAVDIGTTTIAAYLYKLPEGRYCGGVCVPNKQMAFGADVISRLEFARRSGFDRLGEVVREQIDSLTEQFGVDIGTYVITGNTIMLHFFAGLNTDGFLAAPFNPSGFFGQWRGNTYLPDCISAFVGADITMSVIASGMDVHKTALLVDIGTNGEMVLFSGGRYYCCSTAAGPAFEGANIQMGVPSVNGAIDRAYIQNGSICYGTVNNAFPTGICGSGLTDAAACFLELGIVDETGFMEQPYEIGGVVVTPADIRQLQLAKSAIRSGIDTLLASRGVCCGDIEAVYVAGGFGSRLNIESGVRIGLFPAELKEKVKVIGNGAGIGATMLLLNKNFIDKSKAIAKNSETVELAGNAIFSQRFIENMLFE